MCTIAAELEINRYKDYAVDVLRSMIIEKFNVVFARRNVKIDIAKTNVHEKMIQAPLESDVPYEISSRDEIDITECLKNCDIEFIEDKNRDTIPIESTMTDFLRPTQSLLLRFPT